MKTTLIIVIALFGKMITTSAQSKNQPAVFKPVAMENYKVFKKSVQPLIEKMGEKRVVGLGEGTHGTAEFYKLRYWITRTLVEEKGFNHIAFENDYSDSWMLNKQLNSTTDLKMLMKKHLLSIWQNEEVKELLTWVKKYNASHKQQVMIDGIDYVYLKADVELLHGLLDKIGTADLLADLERLKKPAVFQDEAWEGMNVKDFNTDFDLMTKSSYQGYLLADSLDKKITASALPLTVKTDAQLALSNIKQGFAPFYHMINKSEEIVRDVNMAETVVQLLKNPNDKMVIWAHNGHVAKKGIFDGVVGGMGGEISKRLPNAYFVLGTGTARGTFAATTDSRDTYTNPMKAYPLEKPIKGSWEELLAAINHPAIYFVPVQLNADKAIKPMRFIGYTPKSGATTYDKTNISDHFDAFIFIRDTHAATPLK